MLWFWFLCAIGLLCVAVGFAVYRIDDIANKIAATVIGFACCLVAVIIIIDITGGRVAVEAMLTQFERSTVYKRIGEVVPLPEREGRYVLTFMKWSDYPYVNTTGIRVFQIDTSDVPECFVVYDDNGIRKFQNSENCTDTESANDSNG